MSAAAGTFDGVAFGVSWNFRSDRKPRFAVALAGLVVLLATLPGLSASMQSDARLNSFSARLSVIVRETPGSGDAAEKAIERAGGEVGRHIGILNGFVATVPSDRLARIKASEGVLSVTPDAQVRLNHMVDSFDPTEDMGSMFRTNGTIRAKTMWREGHRGRGIDIAMIDSGVVPVNGLTRPNKVIFGPDLSPESQFEESADLDTYGHGTHMAGIMAGRDDADDDSDLDSHERFKGVAPQARVLSVKVASASGATDVSQVLAAIDWVVQHRNDPGMNIKVLNLSFGTDGVQDYKLDPLAYAAEVAWRKGIVVVVAAGNAGFGTAKLNNPAYDPHVIAVGASDSKGTPEVVDDTVPDWSSRGDGARNPDFVAPGKSIVGLRAPGSMIDEMNPQGKVNERFFRGSGTSQSAAVVSGAAALLLSQRPSMTPDQVKHLMVKTATPLPEADATAQGAGLINLNKARVTATPSLAEATQNYPYSTGTGSLEAARGNAHIEDGEGNFLTGEQDIFGTPWDGQTWSGRTWSGQTWSGGDWNGRTWSGQTWSGQTWSGRTWSGRTWSGQTWSGQTWSGRTWSGQTWSGRTWSGQTWSGQTWSGQTWSGQTWSGRTWSGQTWSGRTWSGVEWGDPQPVIDTAREVIDTATHSA